LDELRYVLEVDQGKARAFLAKVLFFKEDVFKKIESLSGGERVRLKWCVLMHQDINLLILDEPTNHLDIDSRQVLEDYLQEFTGTILFVSHDRFFINKMADRILFLENRSLVSYPGSYDDFKEMQSRTALRNDVTEDGKRKENADVDRSQGQKRGSKNRKRKIEADMADIENRIRQLDEEMAMYPADYEKQQNLYKDKQQFSLRLEELLNEWVEME